jgi:hypothetical protein
LERVSAQLQLKMFQAASSDENVRELERLLLEYRGWMSAALIGSKTGWNSDKVNALARASVDLISGQHGYKHIRHATAEEQNHFHNGLRSRARELLRRLIRSQKRSREILA